MPVKDIDNTTESTENKTTTIFQQTPRMSSYLIAFVVSDFESNSINNNTFSVHTKPTLINFTYLALSEGEKLLKEMENFTGIPFSIEKMDQISIPDFAAGAMENWGLVTYA